MVHRRSLEKRLERSHRQHLLNVAYYDREERETICTQELTLPAQELVQKEFGAEYIRYSTMNFEQGEILKDCRGQGTLQNMRRG